MNTTEYLQEQKRLADAATRGPWKRDWYAGVVQPKSRLMTAYEGYNHSLGEYLTEEDARFIAAARSSVPRMIAALEAVRAIHYPFTPQLCYMNAQGGQSPMDSVHCHTCKPEGSGMVGDLDTWPCPTIRAIEAALGD